MLSEQVQYQGKAGFFKLNFQNCISQNTGNCKLGGFLLKQSDIQHHIHNVRIYSKIKDTEEYFDVHCSYSMCIYMHMPTFKNVNSYSLSSEKYCSYDK